MKLLIVTAIFLLIFIAAYVLIVYKMIKSGKIRAKGAKKRRAIIYTLIGINKLFPKRKKERKKKNNLNKPSST